jgi:hypothetical protein
MPKSNTVARSLHDLGLAAWFGGSLMGAVGLNAASGQAGEPKERARVADAGWARWTGPNAVAIGAHLVGGALLLKSNSKRVAAQKGAPTATFAKVALTGVALGVTAYARLEGQKLMDAGDPPILDGTTPSEDTPPDVAEAQRRLKLLQWALPATTGALIVLSAAQGEQQRPAQVAAGVLKRVLPDSIVALPTTAGERVEDARRRARKKARKAARRTAKQAQKRAHRMSKQAQQRARIASAKAVKLGSTAQDAVGRGHDIADRAQERAHDLSDRVQGLGERTQKVAQRTEGRVGDLATRSHHVTNRAQGVLGRAQDVAAQVPDAVAHVGARAEHIPGALAERIAG